MFSQHALSPAGAQHVFSQHALSPQQSPAGAQHVFSQHPLPPLFPQLFAGAQHSFGAQQLSQQGGLMSEHLRW
jgi:hypothetical protein